MKAIFIKAMNLQNLTVIPGGPLLLIIYPLRCMHRLNMELDLQSLFVAPCVQLYCTVLIG